MLSRVAACSLILALAHSLAQATTWTYTDYTEDHKWNTALNWDDGFDNHQVPDNNDTAIIPSNKTCNIESGSAGGWVDYLTVSGTLTVSKDLMVDWDLTVGDTVTINAITTIGRSLIVNSGGTVTSYRRLSVDEIEVCGTLELWPNATDVPHISLYLGVPHSDTTHTLDGGIYFKDDDPETGYSPTMSCAHDSLLKIQPSSAEEDGLISASATESCHPGIICAC